MTWETKLPGVTTAVLPSKTTRPNPLVAGEFVFASTFSPGAVCAAKRKTGELLWLNQLDSLGSESVFLHGRNLYAKSCRTLYALDPRTGRVRWEFSPTSDPGEWIYSSPSARAGRVFIGDRSGYLHCLDAKTGRKLWRRLSSKGRNSQVNSTALVMRDRVICANNQGVVVCYSTENGKTIWRQKVDGACTQELLRFQSKVVVAANSLYAIDVKTGTVCTKWSYSLQTVTSVAVVGSRIAIILGTDFQAQPSAWNKTSAFNVDLVILERGREIARRVLKGWRACEQVRRLVGCHTRQFGLLRSPQRNLQTSFQLELLLEVLLLPRSRNTPFPRIRAFDELFSTVARSLIHSRASGKSQDGKPVLEVGGRGRA
jgi:outer membrane protein assembly factor BamB